MECFEVKQDSFHLLSDVPVTTFFKIKWLEVVFEQSTLLVVLSTCL